MFALPDLPYRFNALEPHIDAQTMEIHHDKHHATYVKNLNEALKDQPELLKMDIYQLVSDLSQVPDEIRVKVKNNGGGHANHSLFWMILSPDGGKEPTDELGEAIKQSFGSFAEFKQQFSESALNRFGSGWAWLVLEGSDLKIMSTANQDSPLMEGYTPILGIDVWEHAYYLKYQNKRADYIEAFWKVVDWEKAQELYIESYR